MSFVLITSIDCLLFCFQHAMATLAKCHLVMGNWEYARMAAEIVLGVDKTFVKAIYAKAEALYNTCQFEHALVYFVRGQVCNDSII